MAASLPWLSAFDLAPALDRPDLLAAPVARALAAWKGSVPVAEITAAPIDPALADTAALTDHYAVPADVSANCVVIAAKRGGETRLCACVVLASTRADVNNLARRHLGARKASFAPMDDAVARTGMEYGGITPFGLPDGWPVLVDAAVASSPCVIVGSGIRASKVFTPGRALAELPGANVLEGLGI